MIETNCKFFRRNPAVCIKHCDISIRMHTGIRAARSDYLYVFFQPFSQCACKRSLHRHCIFLNLPPAVICSIIRNNQSYSPHFLLLPWNKMSNANHTNQITEKNPIRNPVNRPVLKRFHLCTAFSAVITPCLHCVGKFISTSGRRY